MVPHLGIFRTGAYPSPELIPALIGRHLSDIERQILSLPVRYGGVGFANPTKTSDREYEASNYVTENLVTLILNQQQDLFLRKFFRIKATL